MDLLRLEQQRQALEQNLQKLRASLKHWQTLDAELEGFKEEIQSCPPDASPDFESLSKTYDGELVNEKEIRDLAGLDTSTPPRTASQVLDMISHRQEYIAKNIETIQRQFWDAEAKLEELDFVAYQAGTQVDPETAGTRGLPLTEILEELDEDGNVVSSTLSRPEENTAKLVETLRQAGMSEQDLKAVSEEGADDSDGQSATSGTHAIPPPALVKKPYFSTTDISKAAATAKDGDSSPERPSIRKKSVSFSADTKPPPEPVRSESEDGKKTVSFNDKVAVMPAAPPPDNRSVSFSPMIEEIPADSVVTQTENKSVSFSPQVEEIPAKPADASAQEQAKPGSASQKDLRTMFRPGEKVHEINDNDEVTATHIVVPENESEEEARMRREMLDYHLNEVGHIVAEMDLIEDDGYDVHDDDDDEMEDETTSASDFASSERLDEDTPYTSGLSSEDESEDEYGRTKKRVISDDYHKQMQELERRLIGNLGPAPSEQDVNAIDPEVNAADVRRLVIREKRNSMSSANSDSENKAAGKKRVSFAEALDVADEAAPPPTKAAKHENTAPVADTVPERSAPTKAAIAPSAPTPAKTSRFKQNRNAPTESSSTMDVDDDLEDEAPTGPAGKIIADTLMERTTPRRKVAAPSADEPDPIMQRRELAAEYYRRRNDMIRQQGGFTKNAADEDEEGELMEERPDGKLRKVSRFRAARIQPPQ